MIFKIGDIVEQLSPTKSVPRWEQGQIVRAWASYVVSSQAVYEVRFSINNVTLYRLRYESEIRLWQPAKGMQQQAQAPQPSPWAQGIAQQQSPQQSMPSYKSTFTNGTACQHDWKERVLFHLPELYCTKCSIYKPK